MELTPFHDLCIDDPKGRGWSKFFKTATFGCSWQTFHVTG